MHGSNWIRTLCLVVGLGACGPADGPGAPGEDAPSVDTVDVGMDMHFAEVGAGDAATDLGTPDLAGDSDLPFEPECAPGEGCFLDPCDENADCASGWCVQHLGDGVCTIPCQEDCPPGWSCQQVTGSGPDLEFICVSLHANLCRPCGASSECESPGAEDVCVDYGEEGSFCGGICDPDPKVGLPCPWGFSCVDGMTAEGVEVTQCVADAGVCPCTERSVSLSLWTPCEAASEWGACVGKRVCTEEGLSDCDASAPAEEICNGLDDDCDGETDEPSLVEGGYLNLCEDDNDCTEDACLAAEGCAHVALDAGECVDGDACTIGDHCEAGTCVGLPIVCDDDNACTDDHCDGLGGCSSTDNQDPCDDGDPCTVGDQCQGGACAGFEAGCACVVDADCGPADDDLCNGEIICDTTSWPYHCVVDPETVVECPEPEGVDAICLAPLCDPETGSCGFAPANDGYACDDGDLCSVGDQCVDGACLPGVPMLCVDGAVCTDDACEPETGCVFTPNSAACDDGNPCTQGDHCAEGACTHLVLDGCEDGNPCTDDSCDPLSGCVHVLNTAPCTDGDACTLNDLCALGTCVGGPALSCDDGNLCTDDSCDALTGCVFAPNDAPCDDENSCTLGDHCEVGWCLPDSVLDCDDGNECTTDSCHPLDGCIFAPVVGSCDDGDFCNGEETCDPVGGCLPGLPPVLPDDNPCTVDACDEELDQVTHLPDDDLCTSSELCTEGTCSVALGGCQYETVLDCCGNNITEAPEECDDGNAVDGDGCSALCLDEAPQTPGWVEIAGTSAGHAHMTRLDDETMVVAYTDIADRSVAPDHFKVRVLQRTGNTWELGSPLIVNHALCPPNSDHGMKLMGPIGAPYFVLHTQAADWSDTFHLLRREGSDVVYLTTIAAPADSDWFAGHPLDDNRFLFRYRQGNSGQPVTYRTLIRAGEALSLSAATFTRPSPSQFPGLGTKEPQTHAPVVRTGANTFREIRGGYVWTPGNLSSWTLTVNANNTMGASNIQTHANSAQKTMEPMAVTDGADKIIVLYSSYSVGWYWGYFTSATAAFTPVGYLHDGAQQHSGQSGDSTDGWFDPYFVIRGRNGTVYRFDGLGAPPVALDTGLTWNYCGYGPSIVKSGGYGVFLTCDGTNPLRIRTLQIAD